ncbi:MAG: NAD-glutamate dehydrogenase [Alphaproteobacteria bacterium]
MTKTIRVGFQAAFRALVDDPAATAILEQVAQDLDPDDLPQASAKVLAGWLANFWAFGTVRKGNRLSLRLIADPALGLDRLEIIQPDAPFLVDSIMGELAEQGLSVRAMFHPIVEVGRDKSGTRSRDAKPLPESMIMVVLDKVGADREAALIAGIKAVLADVRAAVEDFPQMLGLMGRTVAEVQNRAVSGKSEGLKREEDVAFLTWLRDEHFVYLGARVYEYPRKADGDYAPEEPLIQPESGLGVLRSPERAVLRRTSEPAVLSRQIRKRMADPTVMVAKSNVRSLVHRRGYMDYVGVKLYGPDGRPSGEVRFVGLFTAEAYDKPANEVPLIRAKLQTILAKSGALPGSHNEKRLKNIIENYPRDEVFQAPVGDLLSTAQAILHLYDRPRVRLFERIDPYGRFASILLYVPRERYDSGLRAKAGTLLAEAYGGRISAYYPSFSDAPLARVHFIVGFNPGDHKKPDLRKIEDQVAAAARTWEDRFSEAIRGQGRTMAQVTDLLARYGSAFPAGYKDRYDAGEALADLEVLESLSIGEGIHIRAYRRADDASTQFRFKLYRPGSPAPLADVLPILENMGLKAMVEMGFPVSTAGGSQVWIHDFDLLDAQGEHLVFDAVKTAFEEAFTAVWQGQAENDGFNRLVLELPASWREAALIRALARHRQQSGLDPSQRVQEAALSAHPMVTARILNLFQTKFDPSLKLDLKARKAKAAEVMAEITEALQTVESLDEDRVLRRIALLVGAIQRTNYYQPDPDGTPKPYISFKVASPELADLPLPKPYCEIFVWATHVEGVHLRFGPVARGGLRWSDRRDDFRTEVLALVKAQQVKNAVIVPVGSKGGFYPKQLPKGGSPDAVRAEGVRAYKTFLQGLLDITDNLTADGKVVHPKGVVVHDGDDPYLVVAADKGTATFSDIANGVAESYGFWLGDAFASGGSAGYDHKVMGITARGAWEAVKRHFRELGKDIQSETFTVVGVGDMSGDVFGNGMLLSKTTKLIAAFDHRHIFLDPDPDPTISYAERARMFALPRSSWDDYDRTAISKGGGVFARSLKSIPLSPEIRSALELDVEAVTPGDLIHAILKARVELLYLGGIGTYVKAQTESHADVGDKTNDAWRVNGADLRVKVVGEGANLGLTQAGRIEFALHGGRINTDAIDNSAGVDSSDHEVNIKIATGALERTGILTRPQRDRLLKSMTQDVATHVLQHNYDQTLALSLMDVDAVSDLDAQGRFMGKLESLGRLDRTVEGLPDTARLAERVQAKRGLVRPEEAVLLAYGKLELSQDLVATSAPDDPYFEAVLERYFPKGLRKYDEVLKRHRLRREIIATVIANDVINKCGPSFPGRLISAASCDTRALIVGFEAAKAVLNLAQLWSAVAALDSRVPGDIPASGQMALFKRLVYTLRGETFWLARRAGRENLSVGDLIRRYEPGTTELRKLGGDLLAPVERARVESDIQAMVALGAPQALARQVANLEPLTTAIDLVDLAEGSSWKLADVAKLYQQVGGDFAFDRLRVAAGSFRAGDSFERTALRRLMEDLLAEQASVTRSVMALAGPKTSADDQGKLVEAWSARRRPLVTSVHQALEDIESAGGAWTFAKLTIANAALREMVASVGSR